MSESAKQNDSEKSKVVDLSSLIGMTFGPSWSEPVVKTSEKSKEGQKFKSKFEDRKFEGQRRDRRPQMEKRFDRNIPEFFEPSVEISFYPEDDPFLGLVKAIRTSCKTYELFELASLILEKPERFVAVIAPKANKENTAKLFISPVDGMPFESEEKAIAYSLKNHISKFFDVEEIEVEGPKGSFPVMNRCGFTGELLGPPNYHRYQELIKEHYTNNLSHIPYEKFLSKIESVKDEELVKSWTEKMTKSKRYILKTTSEAEKQVFNTWEDARAYLLANRKKELVREANNVRFHGNLLNNMPKSDIRKALEIALKEQREFPLDTANNIRGRLRRMNLSIYKKGSRGVTYVCAVKRKFRQEGVNFTENLEKLMDFIAKNPNCLASQLPELYLRIKQSADEVSEKTPEQQALIRQVMLDLRWLVSEGYVTEYRNGALFIPIIHADDNAAKKNEDLQEDEVQEEKIQTENVGEAEIQSKKKGKKKKAEFTAEDVIASGE